MSISFEGIGQVTATFMAEAVEDAQDRVLPGMAVALTGDGTVGKGEAGDLPCGVALSVEEDGAAAVQIGGLMSVSYSGTTAPAVGYNTVACDGDGGITVVDGDGLSCLTVSVDGDSQTAVIKL